MNSTDTVNLNVNHARIMTIINAGREQLDRLRSTANIKEQLIDELQCYPDKLEEQVKEEIQVDMDEVNARASLRIQEVVKVVTDRSEQQLQEQLRRKTELHALDTELQIQTDLLERTKQKHEACVQKLKNILREGEKRFEEIAGEFGWSDEMLTD